MVLSLGSFSRARNRSEFETTHKATLEPDGSQFRWRTHLLRHYWIIHRRSSIVEGQWECSSTTIEVLVWIDNLTLSIVSDG